ncbi:MAG: primosomal protein N' (replication factor Y) - superfamily II helicase [Gammaproteobacteria bacterium]|nr:primosomal protein N' (replication factor Y) - superfamily II helicase [Gammaproteobacteria bacterium]
MKADPQDQVRATGEATTAALTETRFPCAQCGAVLHYRIGTTSLECQYCGHNNHIINDGAEVRELDLHIALQRLQLSRTITPETRVISCPNCAAQFAMDAHIHAGECPFCATTVVTTTGNSKILKPKALLPFSITQAEAKVSYKKWMNRLWFAPSALKKYAKADAKLNGIYIPYWTYDSDTSTSYRGQRGDVYYVRQRYRTTVNGRRVTRTRQVPKIRWTPVSGRTSRHFDDVLVGATRTLPRKITDWLEPWDLENLIPYTEEYLSGFSSEVYQVELDEGFNLAQSTMDRIIKNDVANAIGGDQQRISAVKTRHSDTTFKHVLLPLWSAGFVYRDKTYRFVVNGRTGKVRGERPYSVLKILAAALCGAAIAVTALYFVSQSQFNSGFTFSFDDGIGQRGLFDWGSEPAPSRWPSPGTGDRIEFPELPRNLRF